MWVCQGLEPLYPFGHGLSYTTFKYDNLKVRHLPTDPRHDDSSPALYLNLLCEKWCLSPPFPSFCAALTCRTLMRPPSPLLGSFPAQATKSADGGVTVSVDVSNTGDRAGADVPQLYVTFPEAANEPPVQLKGFHKVRKTSGWRAEKRAGGTWSRHEGWLR